MDIINELKLEKLEKPVEEMTVEEAKAALKLCNRNIKKLEKALAKHSAKLQAEEIKNTIKLKASNNDTGTLKPVDVVARQSEVTPEKPVSVAKKSTTITGKK